MRFARPSYVCSVDDALPAAAHASTQRGPTTAAASPSRQSQLKSPRSSATCAETKPSVSPDSNFAEAY